MKVKQNRTEKFTFYTFDNIFDNSEMEHIWKEVDFLCDKTKLLTPEKTGGAVSFDDLSRKLSRKENIGVFLDEVYREARFSNYLSLYKKPLSNMQQYLEDDYTLNLFGLTNYDNTLFTYYENDCYYEKHKDTSCYTYVFWLYKNPKSFTGGDLIFNDIDTKIEIGNNKGILFPSWATHTVDKVIMNQNITSIGQGRFSFTTFFSTR